MARNFKLSFFNQAYENILFVSFLNSKVVSKLKSVFHSMKIFIHFSFQFCAKNSNSFRLKISKIYSKDKNSPFNCQTYRVSGIFNQIHNLRMIHCKDFLTIDTNKKIMDFHSGIIRRISCQYFFNL